MGRKGQAFQEKHGSSEKSDIYLTLAFQVLGKCKWLVETKLHLDLKLQEENVASYYRKTLEKEVGIYILRPLYHVPTMFIATAFTRAIDKWKAN